MESLTELFCLVDDFFKHHQPLLESHLLPERPGQRRRTTRISLSELATLVVLFHQLRFRQFKSFYLHYAQRFLRREFPDLPSYSRCVELMPRCLGLLTALFESLKGTCTGLSMVDSSALAVCDNRRIGSHRVFAGLAARGKTSTGWFYGFKLHIAINHQGELLAAKLTAGNVDDRKPVPGLCRTILGKLFGDKGYLSQELAKQLRSQGVELITKVRKNMKPVARSPFDEAMLRKRSLIETVFDELKNLCQIEHTRHRSVMNFLVNWMAGMVAYCLQPNKPALSVQCSAPITL